jgi:hypothetical protein
LVCMNVIHAGSIYFLFTENYLLSKCNLLIRCWEITTVRVLIAARRFCKLRVKRRDDFQRILFAEPKCVCKPLQLSVSSSGSANRSAASQHDH